MNFNQAKIISVYYNKGDRKPYDVNGKPIAYIGEEFIGSTEATTIRFYLGEDIDSSTATIVTKRADGERRLDICSKVGTGATSYYEVTLNEWYSAVKGKLVVVFKAYNGTVTFDDNENPTEILSVSGRIVVSDIFNLDIAYAPVADLVVPPDATEPYEDWFFALSTKLDKADSITVAGALPTLTGGAYDDRYFYIEDEGVGRLYYINGSTAEEVVFQVGTLKLTPTGNGNVSADTGKLSWEEEYGSVKLGLYDNNYLNIGQDLEYYGKADGAISKGDIIQFGTPEGNHFQIKKAVQSEINANPKLIMGIAKENIADNAFGYVLAFGRIRNINTSAYTIGDFLWFNSGGSTAGEWTTTQPTAPNAKILMAVVVKVANNGIILVRPTIEPKLSELQDINITSIADNQILRWNSANSRWENSSELTTAETNISEILSGDQIVGKATNDKDGNAIDTTYLKVTTASSTYVPLASKGVANGVAPLGADNKIPSIHLPGGVDDIKEFADLASFPATGEASIIYVALDTNLIYRWSGSAYVEISSSLALGTTSSTAFPGDRGLAVETLADNIVDGTQTLTDTRITNSATNVSPLVVNAIASTTANLLELRINNNRFFAVDNGGSLRSDVLYSNNHSISNGNISIGSTGTIISRNINDTNPALVVRKQQGTGNILELHTGTSDKKLEVDVNGWLYQNGTRWIDTNGTGNTHIGLSSGGATIKGEYNVAVGQSALSGINNASATSNIAVGWNAGSGITSGGQIVGVGHRAGGSITSGTTSTFVGHTAGFNVSQLATGTNMTAIGNGSYTDKSNQMVFGNSSVSEFKFDRNASAIALLPQIRATSATYPVISSTRTTASTTGLWNSHELKVLSSGDMTDGFGTGIIFNIGDNTSSSNNIASLVALRSGADNSGRLVFNTFNAGTSTEKMTILPNGNVGIGTGSPVASLQIASLATATYNRVIKIGSGSGTDGNGNYIEFPSSASDNLGSRVGGTRTASGAGSDLRFETTDPSLSQVFERMRIRDSGLVGINETSPSAQLQVKSGATNRVPLIVDTLASHTANLQEWKVNGTTVSRVNEGGAIHTYAVRHITSSANSNMSFDTNGAVISRNVADTNPALIVNLQNSSATGNIQVWQKAGVANATITNSGGATFSGNVGIGTSSPNSILEVLTSSNTDGIQVRRNSTSSGDYGVIGFRTNTTVGGNYGEIRSVRTNVDGGGNSDLTFHTFGGSLGERLTIKHNGLVGINTTSPTAQFQVKSGSTTRIGAIVDSNTGQLATLQEWRVNGTAQAYVEADGDFYNTNGTYGTISDERLKENIVEARNYTEDLMKLRVVKYSLKEEEANEATKLGVIAQEVEQVFPNLISTFEKQIGEQEDGTPITEEYKSVKMSVFIPMLLKVVQELKKEIDELKGK